MKRTCCVQKLILTFRTIYVHNMFSPCSAKMRASDKDLPVKDIKIQSIRYYPTQSDPILDPEGPIQPNFCYTRFKLAQNIFGLVNRRKLEALNFSTL